MKQIVDATKLVTVCPISPADETYHDAVLGAILGEDEPYGRVKTMLESYRESCQSGDTLMGGERYWTNAVAALLIANQWQASELCDELTTQLRRDSGGTLSRLYPMVLTGTFEVAAWVRVNEATNPFLEEFPDTVSAMLLDYTSAIGVGSEPCSDWVAGAFSAAVDKYFGGLDAMKSYGAADRIVSAIIEIHTMRAGSVRLFEEFAFKLFRPLSWPQKLRALKSGYARREIVVHT